MIPLTVLAIGLAACHAPADLSAHAPPTALPGPTGGARIAAPETPAEALPGVDTTDLSARERATFWKLVTSLYAPCADQPVSVAACVREGRACAACPGAARLLASRVRAGASAADAERAYAARFGTKVTPVPIDDSPSRGPEGAPVTVVVWSDFDCPHCRFSVPVVDEVRERFAPNVRVVHKLYPLRSHANSDGAARAAVAAHQQGRFWELERVLFDHQGALGEGELEGYAKLAGLDVARFRADLASPVPAQRVARDRDEADAAGLDGTPFVVINGRPFDLGLFRLHDDLAPWIALEIELAGARRVAAVKR